MAKFGSAPYLAHILEANFLGHTCATSACVVPSNIQSAGCTPSATSYASPYCTQQQISYGNIAFSRNASDAPNTLYELALPQVYKDTFTTGSTMGVNDHITRSLYIDFSGNGGGSLPCAIVPSDYQSRWNGGLDISDGGALTLASAGGGSYQTIWQQMGLSSNPGATTVTNDVFIMPVDNVAGIAYFMFQASNGTTSGTEPNWAVNCPAQGSSCTDGSVTWTNIGAVDSQGPGFNVLHYDPSYGCRRINSRLGKTYNGAGVTLPAGAWITDDATVCYRKGGSNCGSGGTVALDDKFTLHAADQMYNSEFGELAPTGGGSVNKNYAGGGGSYPEIAAAPNGSCNETISYTAFASWPNPAWVAGNEYAKSVFVTDTSDANGGNYYETVTTAYASTPSTIAPHLDTTNWKFAGYYCYAYIVDWTNTTGPMVRPILEIGPNFGADGHNAQGYLRDYRGGVYWSHFFNQPNCQTTSGCPLGYVGAPNPGVAALTASLPNDGHPTSRNVGTADLQPIFDPTTSVPSWGGVGLALSPQCTNPNGGTQGSYYCAAGYNEEIAFIPGSAGSFYRFGHNYNTGSNSGFGIQNAIGVISQDGKMLAYTSDFMTTRGDRVTGSATCVSPLRGQYSSSPGQAVTYHDQMLPVTNNKLQTIYQAAGFWNGATSTYTFSGSGAEGSSIPNWNTSCPNAGNYCTVDGTTATAPLDGNVLWLNLGANSCRGDIGLMDVTSAHAAP